MKTEKFLKKIQTYIREYYQSLPNAEYVRLETMQKSIYIPANSGFPATVLAMKDCCWENPVYIVHEEKSTADGGSIDSYSTYKLSCDGFVRRIEKCSPYEIYGEKEVS